MKWLAAASLALILGCSSSSPKVTDAMQIVMLVDMVESAETDEQRDVAVARLVSFSSGLNLVGIEPNEDAKLFAAWLVSKAPELVQYEAHLAKAIAYADSTMQEEAD